MQVATGFDFTKYTLTPCVMRGTFLGEGSVQEHSWDIVDTPGFSMAFDNGSFKSIIEFLKKEVKVVNTFAILFSANDNRFTYYQQQMLQQLHEGFGPSFWNNVVFVVTKWSMHFNSVGRRREAVPPLTQELMKEVLLQRCQNLLKIEQTPRVFFIDSFHNRHTFDERHVFYVEALNLFRHTKKQLPFDCSNIKPVLNELETLKAKAAKMQASLEVVNARLEKEQLRHKNLTEYLAKLHTTVKNDLEKAKRVDPLLILLIFAIFLVLAAGGAILTVLARRFFRGFVCVKMPTIPTTPIAKIEEEDFQMNFV